MKCPVYVIKNENGLNRLKPIYDKNAGTETIPYARGTGLYELCNRVVPDKERPWKNPLFWVKSTHRSNIGRMELCKMINRYLEDFAKNKPLDILSILSALEEDEIVVYFLVRIYNMPENTMPYFDDLYDYIGTEQEETVTAIDFREAIKESSISLTEEEQEEKNRKIEEQDIYYQNATREVPFLNALGTYTKMRNEEGESPIYDLDSRERAVQTMARYEDFIEIFQQVMRFVYGTERDSYFDVIRNKAKEEDFLKMVEAYIMRTYIAQGYLRQEDLHFLMKKIRKSLFQLYIIQDLIDDPDISDIKIVSPYDVRVRINGKAYQCNITFIDDADYERFIKTIKIRNEIDEKVPKQTFTEQIDENYILRFSLTSKDITPKYPSIHVRKISRNKKMADTLIKEGLFDEKIRDYLLDCGIYSRGVVFAGPPGSGKTTILNWFLEEAYEDSAEILVIQENDELFSNRKGVMFEHVVNNPAEGKQACSLEQLGQMALVSGANVFIIGEAKGAEICSAITLANSGCRTAITIHSPSSTKTIGKMADLALRGYAQSYEQAVRMLQAFQTIVYLQDYKVQEITEIEGYDEVKKKIKYRYIYRRE